MAGIVRGLGGLPLILRCAVVGSVSVATIAAVVALITALGDHPQTAWFAVLEGGFLGAVAGAALGLLAGLLSSLLAAVARRIGRRG